MSSKHHGNIAKEIVDQTLSHFKKIREENAAVKQSHPQEVERKPQPKYEPSANFVKTFSEIMGEKAKVSNDVKLSENPRLKSLSLKVDPNRGTETEDAEKTFNEKTDPPQAPVQTVVSEHKEEDTNKPPQPSIFERMSRRESAENAPQEPEEEKQSTNKEDAQKETVNSNPRISVFEKLSRSTSSS